jgi:hypothetical protein
MFVLLVTAAAMLTTAVCTAAPTLLFVTSDGANDMLLAAGKDPSVATMKFTSIMSALRVAKPEDGLLVMADGMRPADPGVPRASANATVVVEPAEWDAIRRLRLKVYVEFPRSAPFPVHEGRHNDSRGLPLQLAQTMWERVVVSSHAGLGPGLPYLALLHPHKKVDYVRLPPAWLPHTSLVIAKVVWKYLICFSCQHGISGLPGLTQLCDLLLCAGRLRQRFIRSTTSQRNISAARDPSGQPRPHRRRHAALALPSTTMGTLAALDGRGGAHSRVCLRWRMETTISSWARPGGRSTVGAICHRFVRGENSRGGSLGEKKPLPTDQHAARDYVWRRQRDETLPADAEHQALIRGVQFYRNARLLPNYRRAVALAMLKGAKEGGAAFARLSPPFEQPLSGEGQLGVFEGLTSDISVSGKQPQSNGMRCDCVTETSASFAVRSVVTGNASDVRVAQNLLNYGHVHAGYSQPWAIGAGSADTRPWVVSGDAFGLMSWTTHDEAYELMYHP